MPLDVAVVEMLSRFLFSTCGRQKGEGSKCRRFLEPSNQLDTNQTPNDEVPAKIDTVHFGEDCRKRNIALYQLVRFPIEAACTHGGGSSCRLSFVAEFQRPLQLNPILNLSPVIRDRHWCTSDRRHLRSLPLEIQRTRPRRLRGRALCFPENPNSMQRNGILRQ